LFSTGGGHLLSVTPGLTRGLPCLLREQRLRPWKYELINAMNPTWRDLAEDFGFDPLPLVRKKAGPGPSPG
jgi:hypothetical protein